MFGRQWRKDAAPQGYLVEETTGLSHCGIGRLTKGPKAKAWKLSRMSLLMAARQPPVCRGRKKSPECPEEQANKQRTRHCCSTGECH